MPMDRSRYPKNWKEIADGVKRESNWKCEECGLDCFPYMTTRLNRSEMAKRTLTVHHQDYNPANNERDNLIALCSACHLRKHQGKRGNVSQGQFSLFEVEPGG